jgi:hypothetical protein
MSELAKQIIDTLANNRPNISSSSIKTYTSLLTTLLKKLDSDDIRTFNDTKKVIEFVSNMKSAQTQKTILSALYVLTTKEAYKEAMVSYSNEVNKQYAQKKTTESRKESGINQEKIQQLYELTKQELVNNPSYDNYNDYIIICLTSGLFMPPRRSLDWIAIKINNIDKTKDNYINGNYFIFNKFKTSKFVKDEDKKILIPIEIKKIIAKWRKVNKTDYLLFQKNGNSFSSSSFTKTLNRLYGKGVSTDMLRSMYLTNRFGNVADKVAEMNKITKEMGSSTNSALQYYVKSDMKK